MDDTCVSTRLIFRPVWAITTYYLNLPDDDHSQGLHSAATVGLLWWLTRADTHGGYMGLVDKRVGIWAPAGSPKWALNASPSVTQWHSGRVCCFFLSCFSGDGKVKIMSKCWCEGVFRTSERLAKAWRVKRRGGQWRRDGRGEDEEEGGQRKREWP